MHRARLRSSQIELVNSNTSICSQHVQMGWCSKRPAGLSWPCGNAPRSAFELRSNAPWSNPAITASSTARHHCVIDFTSPRACGPSCSLKKREISSQASFCRRNYTSSLRPELSLPTSTLSTSRANPSTFCFFRLSARTSSSAASARCMDSSSSASESSSAVELVSVAAPELPVAGSRAPSAPGELAFAAPELLVALPAHRGSQGWAKPVAS